jgi:hypothetical protein
MGMRFKQFHLQHFIPDLDLKQEKQDAAFLSIEKNSRPRLTPAAFCPFRKTQQIIY